jgi:Fe-S-cluster containining protein
MEKIRVRNNKFVVLISLEKSKIKSIRVKMFECKRCGKCCENPGEVAIFEWEKEIIKEEAKKLENENINENIIAPGIAAKFGKLKVILQWKILNKGKCVFFDEESKSCKIYENRPLACRAYPLACSGINLREAKEIIGEECKNAIIPFNYGEKITKRELIERLKREYGEIFSWAFRLDIARIFVMDLIKFYEEEIKNLDFEDEIGLLELLEKEKLYDKESLEYEIKKIYNLKV